MPSRPRKEFEMTPKQLDAMKAASKPVRYMVVGGVFPRSPQDDANDAWRRLGQELGFNWKTVRPASGKSARFFTATPMEVE